MFTVMTFRRNDWSLTLLPSPRRQLTALRLIAQTTWAGPMSGGMRAGTVGPGACGDGCCSRVFRASVSQRPREILFRRFPPWVGPKPAEGNNDGPGLLDPGTDAVPAEIHGDFVELLGFMTQSGVDFGRLYKESRYPWLAV